MSSIVRLSELQKKQRGIFFAQLVDKTPGITKNKNPFLVCRFRDRKRTATFMVWGDGPHYEASQRWEPGQFFKIHATYDEHAKYGGQIDVIKITLVEERHRVEGFDEADFLIAPERAPAIMWNDLLLLVDTITDEPLQRLTRSILEANAERLQKIPAHERRFYTFRGGWLEHTLHVTRNAIELAKRYRERFPELSPPINVDLVAAAAVLHDVGRAVEFVPSEVATDPIGLSVEGRLLGHLFLGRDLVRDAAREQGDVDAQLLLMLEHIIVSHLNHPEWGSARLPLIPEVLILHHIDDLDAKMEMFARCLIDDVSPGPFTAKEANLNRMLFKGRSQ